MSVNIYDMNYYFKIIIILFLFGCKPIYISKKDKESYNAINETIYEITKTKKGAEIYLFERPIPINTMLDKNFFTKTYLKEVYGNGGVLGVDSRKISNLLKEIDLNTVATEKIDKAQRWDSSQFRFPYRFLKKNIKTQFQNINRITYQCLCLSGIIIFLFIQTTFVALNVVKALLLFLKK